MWPESLSSVMPGLSRLRGRSRFGEAKARASTFLNACGSTLMAGTGPAMTRGAGNSRLTTACSWTTDHCNSSFNNNSSAVLANTCMLPVRSLLPVSSVITFVTPPATAMQLWPAASP